MFTGLMELTRHNDVSSKRTMAASVLLVQRRWSYPCESDGKLITQEQGSLTWSDSSDDGRQG